MNYFGNEKEINIKNLMYYFALKWKKMFLCVVISMVITLGVNSYNAYKYYKLLGIKTVLYTLMRHMIIVGVIVGVIYALLIAFVYIFSDTIKSTEEFMKLSRIKVIDSICLWEDDAKAKKSLIKKILGINKKQLSLQHSLKYISKIIVNDPIIENNDLTNIAVVSTLQNDKAEKFTHELSDMVSEKINLIYVGDYQVDQDAIEKICNADYVVLIEYQYCSKYVDIEKMCVMMDRLNKNTLGVVLVEQN